jgi:hypothetical protein
MSIRRFISFSLNLLLLMSLVMPNTASAIEIVPPIPIKDEVIRIKEAGISVLGVPVPGTSLDSIATTILKRSLEAIANSTVDWINSGFDGNPTFVTDPGQHFLNIADSVAGEYIEGAGLSGLCSPFQASIRISLQQNYMRSTGRSSASNSQCTLTGIVGNIENFYQDFSEGGWAGWLSMTQNDNNNPYGAYIKAEIELDSRLANVLKIEEDQLNWGQGFLSTKGPDGQIRTPGTVIEGQLQNVLGTGVRQLELADEFDEIIGALVSQLLQRTVFSQGGLGSERGGSSSGGNSGGNTGQPNNPTPQDVVACVATSDFARVGETVIWLAQSSLGAPIYVWTGEGIEGQNTPSVSVVYEEAGVKSASVVATGIGTSGQSRTITANCQDTITILGQGTGTNPGSGLGSGGVTPI